MPLLASSLATTPPTSAKGGAANKEATSDEDSDDGMENEDEDDEEEEEIPLDMEEIEAVSKKARQEEEIHSEHMQAYPFKVCFTF